MSDKPKHLTIVGGNSNTTSSESPKPECLIEAQIRAICQKAIDKGAVTFLAVFEYENDVIEFVTAPKVSSVAIGLLSRLSDMVLYEEEDE